MERNNNKRVFGVYNNEADAQRAIEELLNMGYTSEQISVLSRSGDNVAVDGSGTATEAGLKGGAATGATIGGVGGLLAGLGLLAIPGIGPILAAGPLAAAFAGAVTGGAIGGTIGTLGGVMMDAGVDEEDARYADERFQAGDIIVYVDTDVDRFDRVSDTLGYRSWNTDFNPNSKTVDTVYQGDSDLRHDRDLDAVERSSRTYDDRDRGTKDQVSDAKLEAERLIDQAKNLTQPVNNEVYSTDSDLRHDNLDLDVADESKRTYDERDSGVRDAGVRDERVKDTFDRTENRVQDAVTDTSHEVEKNAEKLGRRVDNAGEPLEGAQNWTGDKVSDVKHEAGKLIDKAKNRTDD